MVVYENIIESMQLPYINKEYICLKNNTAQVHFQQCS